MRKFRTYAEADPGAHADVPEQVRAQHDRLHENLSTVGTVVAVVSGKGGVGKSAITANLAAALARRGHAVGVVDGDLNGPSQGRMLGASGQRLVESSRGIVPATGVAGVRVMSLELLQADEDAPLRWRGPGGHTFTWQSVAETSVLREFLADVHWGPLDTLLIDLPPGTDKISRLLELLDPLDLALVVTTPSEMARFVVAKSVRLLQEAAGTALGLVGNMTAYVPEDGGGPLPLFPGDGVAELARGTGIPVWGEVPFDPVLARETDRGRPPLARDPHGAACEAIDSLAERIQDRGAREATPRHHGTEAP